jgi:general stress protein 26
MNRSEIIQESIGIIESTNTAYFTTIDAEGFPQTRAIFNMRCRWRFPHIQYLFENQSHELMVYLTTNTSSDKIHHLASNIKVCVYFCRPDDFVGVMLSGTAEIVADPIIKNALWQEGWEVYYGSVDNPDYTVLRLMPTKAKGWLRNEPFLLTWSA